MPQRRRWIVVDGSLEARQAHGRAVSLQLRRTAARGLPTMESQHKPNDGRREHIETKQRTARQADAAKSENVPKALHGLRSCFGTQPSCGCAPD